MYVTITSSNENKYFKDLFAEAIPNLYPTKDIEVNNSRIYRKPMRTQ